MIKRKIYAWTCIWIMLIQLLTPVHSYALTGGPSQPEFSAFEPVGTTQMVDLPSGNFQYNIALMDVGGYPLNLAYHAGITADMEAACVGLGWTINPGVINRNVRAIPDDFNGAGDEIVKEFNMKPNVTVGASVAPDVELFGKRLTDLGFKMKMNMGVFYNTYAGLGYEFGLSPSFSAGNKSMGALTASMGMSMNSQNGANFKPSLSYSKKVSLENRTWTKLGAKIGLTINSREGLSATNLSSSITDESNENPYEEDHYTWSAGGMTSAKFSYASKSYTPHISMPMNNSSYSMSFKPLGAELFGTNSSASFTGYVSVQNLRNKVTTKKPFGMLYAQNGYASKGSLMDFSREKEAIYHDYSVSLPIVRQGSDVYSLSGQGIGGSYQLKRGDVPMFFDSKSTSVSNGGNLGAEMGFGNAFHGGVDIHFNNTNSETGKWSDNNELLKNYNFSNNHTRTAEPAYFKAAGEMAVESDKAYYNGIGKNRAVRASLSENGPTKFHVQADPKLVYGNNTAVANTSPVVRSKRDRRNQAIAYLTAAEAKQVALDKEINAYPINKFNGASAQAAPSKLSRVSAVRKAHHISQIESVRADGMRYVYGIPAYNLLQEETTFNVTGRSVDCATGKVNYSPAAKDDTNENKLGKDHFFSSVKTPAYAHSYLLTSVLSQDYEDVDGNGLSPNDNGSYTKINYSRTSGADGYKWRVPFEKDQASYNPGLFSKSSDDKGSRIFGSKEIWLVHSVESKNMVAEFTYDRRFDGFGVENKDGGFPTTIAHNFNMKLEKITLYAKPDRMKNGNNATPIKTVHFEYNYELCPNTPNSKVSTENPNSGKLTLKKLYYTYGHSKKGKLSAYDFVYKGSGAQYDMKSYDRWGNYKPNTDNPSCKNPTPGQPVPNDEFPYAEQNEKEANANAGVWSLHEIQLPSGGVITVDYKAKHYSHVQDRSAMKMMKITGIGKVKGDNLYDLNPLPQGNPTNHLKVFFDLEGHSVDDYLKGIAIDDTYVYLKCYVRLNTGPVNAEKWEYVSLYSKITGKGTDPSGHGFVVLKPIVDNNQPNLNPISKYSFQFIREHLPAVAYDQSTVTAEDLARNPLNSLKPIASMASQLVSFIVGFNRTLLLRGYAKKIDVEDLSNASNPHPGRSFIRLSVPNGIKYGGGAMVSKIEISDNWGMMTTGNSSDNFSYGQEYDYSKIDPTTGKKVSSGVASYEPMIGGDENPFRKPVVINEERKWAVDNIHYVEEPFGESFMPAPQVLFSEIKVRDLSYSNVKRTATGHSLMKYYTAKDFPVKIQRTDLQKEPRKIKPILSLVKLKVKEHTNASQGFLIGTNNMHGQAQAKEVYDENGTLISKVEYLYKTNGNNELDNEVEVINVDGTVSKELIGVETQLAGDARQSIGKTISGGVNMNFDGFLAGIIPVVIPLPWPSYKSNERRYRSMSMTKVVKTNGILDKVVAYDLGSTIATDNLAYDGETGEVLLTRTYNEFDDPIYSLKYAAHLAYEGMQGAYKNIGYTASMTDRGNGIYATNTADPFVPGDELALYSSGNVSSLKAWILHVDKSSNRIFLIDRNGGPVIGGYDYLKIIRSGHRNMPTTSIGSLTSKQNPIQGSQLRLNTSSQILNAGALEFSEDWKAFCSTENTENCPQSRFINPFVTNELGNWKSKKSWLHLSERDRTPLATTVSNTNIRENGFYTSFSPFWNSNGGNPWNQNRNNWIWTTEVTQFNPNGTELENKDKLDRFSAEIVGYGNQLVTGVAANSRYRQMAFDGFEDYHYNQFFNNQSYCRIPRHFGNNIPTASITDKAHHTGNYALQLGPGRKLASRYKIEENCPTGSSATQRTGTSARTISLTTYNRDDCNCIQPFSPNAGKYVVTAWVKEGDGLGQTKYTKHNLRINTLNSSSSNTIAFKASGAIIEGWQRIEGEFDINPTDTDIEVVFESTGTAEVFFDDLRIFPFDGEMKNFVYDDVSLKLSAEIDANGFANFYEYDISGALVRIKKETERGVLTIQESRSAQPKK